MLTREMLSAQEWGVVRDAPHLVMLAVASASDGPMDRILERHAAVRGFLEAGNSSLPLVRSIGEAPEIMAAYEDIRNWFHGLADAERTPENLQEKALQWASRALDVVRDRGQDADLHLYREFVLASAMRVARAAREGDVLGVGGQRVSVDEAHFIRRLEAIATSNVEA